MNHLITSLFRAIGSLRSGALIKILILSMLLNGLLLMALIFGVNRLVASIDFGLYDFAIDWGATFISGVIAYFIYPLLLPLMISFFDTAIADAIEREEYQNLPDTEPPYWPTLAQDIKFTLKVLLINLLILPLYLLPGVNILLYFVVNGYLIGIEFFHVVAGRHIARPESDTLKRKHRFTIALAGIAITVCSTIPFVNLVAPMIGVAMMVHYFHTLKPDYKVTIETPKA
jgi:CysZ protein